MSDLNISKIVGESFEDMSISQMTLIQGSGEEGEYSISSAISALTFASTMQCATVSAAITGGIHSLLRC